MDRTQIQRNMRQHKRYDWLRAFVLYSAAIGGLAFWFGVLYALKVTF